MNALRSILLVLVLTGMSIVWAAVGEPWWSGFTTGFSLVIIANVTRRS